MTTPAKSSRWGSLLQQAVAGVEARLDNILAEGEAPPKPGKPSTSQAATLSAKSSTVPSRSPSASSNRANDRLQERLAKAVAARSNATPDQKTPSSPRPSEIFGQDDLNAIVTPPSDQPPMVTIPADDGTRARQENGAARLSTDTSLLAEVKEYQASSTGGGEIEAIPIHPLESRADHVSSTAADLTTESVMTPQFPGLSSETCSHCHELEATIKHLQNTLDEAQARQQDEIHGYVEQTDALQAKLQFLSREVTDAARKEALSAPAGSVERKLAEKDEKIALLLGEGQTLAATEQKHRSIIRKLRSKIADDEKTTAELRSAKDKAESEVATVRSGASRAEELEKLHAELRSTTARLNGELESLRSQVVSKDSLASSLKAELQKETTRADTMEARLASEVAGVEKRHQKELEDTVAALELEKSLLIERARNQASELTDKAERAAERSRATELEMKGELQVMEAKLEAMRALAEEASSGAIGDSQAKLLRQVETLQTQYATASDNWQGIETSLVARIANLEKERDEALRRESDMRRKAREAATRSKRQEEELQDMKTRFSGFQREAEITQSRVDSMRKRAEAAEAALLQARSDFEKQQTLRKSDMGESAEKGRSWLDELPSTSSKGQSRPESPLFPMPSRTFSSDVLVFQAPVGKQRKVSTPSSLADGMGDGQSLARRPSGQPLSRPQAFPTHAGPSPVALTSPFESHPETIQALSPLGGESDDVFDGLETSSSPHQVMQDVMSVSTVAAGPSVQLVERMSAAIRRLEGEKMAAREELARISSQRDEARAEIVGLMKEVEEGKSAFKRVAELESEVADINSRYQTTLEMLGEKSELVEELRADVQDVKTMYRELVERTVK